MAIVHGVAKRWTQTEQPTLSLSFHFHLSIGKVVLTHVYLDQKQMEREIHTLCRMLQPSATHKAENIFVGRMAEFFADLQHTYINYIVDYLALFACTTFDLYLELTRSPLFVF